MNFRVKAIAAALGAMGMFPAGQVGAAGFQLMEQNASGIGNAYAGTAAVAEDASTIFFNPAGMSHLKGHQVVISGDGVKPSSQFNNLASTLPGTNGPDAGDWAFIPAAYYSYQVNDRFNVGASLNAPFGLKTEYDTLWVGRTKAIESELKTLAIGLSGSYKVTDKVALGLGIAYQKADATLTSCANVACTVQAQLNGDDWGWGWNVGVIGQVTPSTRLGVSYRSAVDYTLEGTVVTVTSTPVKADLKLPGMFTMSAQHQLNDRWEILADAAWTDWSTFKSLTVVSVTGALVQNTPENWNDSWRFALGANYKVNDQWKLRLGVAYDQTPVEDIYRTARVPDNDRTWLAIGAQYKASKTVTLDVGYAHLFISDPSINEPAPDPTLFPPSAVRLVGSYDSSVDIIGVQASFSF